MGYVVKQPATQPMCRVTISSWKLLGAGFLLGVGWTVAQAIIISLNSPEFAELCSTIGGLF